MVNWLPADFGEETGEGRRGEGIKAREEERGFLDFFNVFILYFLDVFILYFEGYLIYFYFR